LLEPLENSDTPLMDTPHTRRMVTMTDYEYADLIDSQDKIRMLADPTSTYARAAAAAMGRAMDDVIIAAMYGAAKLVQVVQQVLHFHHLSKSFTVQLV
jgi:hypothetical protein